jgi:anti-anti-sigma factor
MKAKLSVKEDVVVVNLSGRINMEYTDIFHQACLNEIGSRGNKIIFNLKELSFVGSNGIMPFVNALTALAQKDGKQLRFCGVGSEFKKVFAASPLSAIAILDSLDGAFASLNNLDFIESDPA